MYFVLVQEKMIIESRNFIVFEINTVKICSIIEWTVASFRCQGSGGAALLIHFSNACAMIAPSQLAIVQPVQDDGRVMP